MLSGRPSLGFLSMCKEKKKKKKKGVEWISKFIRVSWPSVGQSLSNTW
jgi:hypothetical protein